MTTIKYGDNYIAVNGHSGYAEIGSDIVCAAISTLIESTYRYLVATDNNVRKKEGDAFFKIEYEQLNSVGEAIIEEFENIANDIEEEYSNYVRSEYNERT